MLRPVPVVNVPIDDQDPLHAIPFLRIPRRDRHIVEQAETHRPIGFRMVPRRTDRTESMLDPAGHNRIHPGQGSTGREIGGAERSGRHGGIGVERDPAMRRRLSIEHRDILRPMHQRDPLDVYKRQG